ncbi:MAG: alcohol dehydrogenase catalytic domain-containing protein [Candidatus Dormibacteria bacterium]
MREAQMVVDNPQATMRALVLEAAGGEERVPQLRERVVSRPVPPAPGWVLVRPSMAGVCSDDLALLHGEGTDTYPGPRPELPAIPGREVVGHVERALRTSWAREGARVLVEPNAGCAVRGFPPCSRCIVGDVDLCENRNRRSPLGPGAGGGIEAGGGWSEGILVAEDMLVPADGISDQRAVLGVGLATAVHAVLRSAPRGDRVAVIGSGTTTRLLVAALSRLHPDVDITVILDARGPSRRGRRSRRMPASGNDEAQVEAAFAGLGAARAWRGSAADVLDRTSDLVSARRLRDGQLPVLDRGLDAVFDCRGTLASANLGLHLLRAGGSLVLTGCGAPQGLSWDLVTRRSLTVIGSRGFGQEPAGWRTFAAVREWLVDESFPVDGLVTHRYPFDSAATAIATAQAGAAMGAVKVVFEGPHAPLRDRPTPSEPAEEAPAGPVLLASTAARSRRSDADVPR